jgi:DUF1680 family protein
MISTKLEALPLKNIRIRNDFWSRYINLINQVTIPYQWSILNDNIGDAPKGYCINNLKIAAKIKSGEFGGMVFQDTDLAKWLETVAYSLEVTPNCELQKTVDDVINLIEKAQQKDGYINTYFTLVKPEGRWSNLMEGHELYTAGHFIEAAVAYYKATGKDKFLNIMRKFVDYIATVFGYGENQLKGYPGHQEIELALVKLYHVTQDKKYLDLATYFIKERGKEPYYFDEERKKLNGNYIFPEFEKYGRKYNQTHLPVMQQETAEGHAVRATYMYAAMADLSFENNDDRMFEVCEKIYDNIINRKMYITGSIGSAASGESFTCDYDLPNDTNYSETCASIGLVLFAQRMLQITRDAKYADVIEKALYNTVLAGMSLKGNGFFYVNPLEVWPESCENNPTKSHVKAERQQWFSCACCPPNIARTLTSLGQYIYGISEQAVFVNLFLSNEATFKLKDSEITLHQITEYPFKDTTEIIIGSDKSSEFTLALRIPGWCSNAIVTVNGVKFDIDSHLNKGYVFITREWQSNDIISITFDMPPRLVFANPLLRADAGKAAIVKGPLVYCLEECDNGGNLSALEIKPDVQMTDYFDKSLLGGTNVITLDAQKIVDDSLDGDLYRFKLPKKENTEIKVVPYCMWNNRGKGEMLVWIRLT